MVDELRIHYSYQHVCYHGSCVLSQSSGYSLKTAIIQRKLLETISRYNALVVHYRATWCKFWSQPSNVFPKKISHIFS